MSLAPKSILIIWDTLLGVPGEVNHVDYTAWDETSIKYKKINFIACVFFFLLMYTQYKGPRFTQGRGLLYDVVWAFFFLEIKRGLNLLFWCMKQKYSFAQNISRAKMLYLDAT